MSARSVLISGAGIAGPTLAYWLRRRGFRPTIVERAPRFREGGYMMDFWGVGFDVAERMNLLPRLREVGYLIERVKFVDEQTRVRSQIDANAMRRALNDRFISLPRGDLAKAIFDTIANDVEVIFDDTITELDERPDGVEVRFDRSQPRKFDLIAGCDGLHSVVREKVFGPENQFEKYLGYYAASFLTANYPHRDEDSYLSYGAPGRQISRYTLRGGWTAVLFVFERRNPFNQHLQSVDPKAQLREAFGKGCWIEIPQILERLDQCEDIYFDSVSQIRISSWSRGRSILLGDAAFCPSLLAGEGAGLAMAGAYVLAGELQRAGGDHAQGFGSYEQRLRAFVEGRQRSAERFASSFAPKTHFGLFLRDLVLRSASLPQVSNWLTRRFISDNFELPEFQE